MWSEVHRPQRVEQMVGNEDARIVAVKWLSGWVSGAKPLLLVGPPGVGKTTIVHALARQFDYDLVEMNASDVRNRDSIEARIKPVFFANTGLFGRKILLFLDEVDGISGREDSGGLDALVDLIKEPTVPVIMAANEKSAKMKELAKGCKVVEFSPVPPRLLLMFLDHVLAEEKAKLGPGDRVSIVVNSGGDIRSLLNGAQSRVAGYATASNSDVAEIDIADAVNGYFAARDRATAVQALARADASFPDPRYEAMSPEARRKDMVAALFSSIVTSRSLDKESLADLLDALSKADVVVGRVSRNRQWSLLRYVRAMLAGGLYEKSRGKDIRYSQYAMPWPVMGPIFARSQTIRKIASAVAQATNVSRRTASSTVLPYLVRAIIDEKVDVSEFAIASFGDESIGESLEKEVERAKGARKKQ